MKNLSVILTLLLIAPIGYTLFSVFEIYHVQSIFMRGYGGIMRIMLLRILSPVLIDLGFIGIAVFLNVKMKYYENSIMCGTILLGFLVTVILNFGSLILFQWLK